MKYDTTGMFEYLSIRTCTKLCHTDGTANEVIKYSTEWWQCHKETLIKAVSLTCPHQITDFPP